MLQFTERAQFEAALSNCTRLVDFDDIDTLPMAPVSFAFDRYESTHGIVITGAGGQLLDESGVVLLDRTVKQRPFRAVAVILPSVSAAGMRYEMDFPGRPCHRIVRLRASWRD